MKNQQLTVNPAGLTSLVTLLGRDCEPTQFLREYVMNSVEAIQRVLATEYIDNYKGNIEVDYDKDFYEKFKVFKLSFTDNGDGMTLNEMLTHLNSLSSSGHRNTYQNYGVGGKIASLTRNHVGIVYKSWPKHGDGSGAQIILEFDKATSCYGVKPFSDQNGNVFWSKQLSQNEQPGLIKNNGGHGTQVTLLGMEVDADTMLMPTPRQKGGVENWLYQYCNTRFYELPKNIKLSVRIAHQKVGETTSYLGQVRGHAKTMERNSVSSGQVTLSDATLYWHILEDKRQGHGREYVKGHIACLNQNEIIDVQDGRSSRASDFGIFIGKDDIVLFLEPNNKYIQNTARTKMVGSDGSPLPWNDWADDFRAQMPDEIKQYMKKRIDKETEKTDQKRLRDKLKEVEKLLKVSKYRLSEQGDVKVNPEQKQQGKTNHIQDKKNPTVVPSHPRPCPEEGRVKEWLNNEVMQNGKLGERIAADSWPEINWTTPAQFEELEDKMAMYEKHQNIVFVNKEFQGYLDVPNYFNTQFKATEETALYIKSCVNEAFEQQLMEVIFGVLSLKQRPYWSPDAFEMALSPEALTTATMARYHLLKEIRGKLKVLTDKKLNAA